MKANGVELFAVVFVSVFFMGVLSVTLFDEPRFVKYDCRLVDVSPDMPEDVKRICRSRR